MPPPYGDSPLAIGVLPQRPQQVPLHQHNYVELVVIESGQGVHLAGRQRLPLHPGDVFVVPPGFPHGYADCQNLHLMNLCFDMGRLDLPLASLQRLSGWQGLFAIDPARRLDHGFRGHLRLGHAEKSAVLGDMGRVQSECVQSIEGVNWPRRLCCNDLGTPCRLYEEQLGSDPELANSPNYWY